MATGAMKVYERVKTEMAGSVLNVILELRPGKRAKPMFACRRAAAMASARCAGKPNWPVIAPRLEDTTPEADQGFHFHLFRVPFSASGFRAPSLAGQQ